MNVVANDLNAFERNGLFVYFLVMAPPFMVIAAGVLYYLIGPSCFAGIGYIFVAYPLQNFLAKKTGKPRNMKNKITDNRVKLANEMIEGIRLLKMYAWEAIFSRKVSDYRKDETKQMRNVLWLEGVCSAIAFSS